jgi:hypothetical protein
MMRFLLKNDLAQPANSFAKHVDDLHKIYEIGGRLSKSLAKKPEEHKYHKDHAADIQKLITEYEDQISKYFYI